VKVIENVTIRQRAYDFLLIFHSNVEFLFPGRTGVRVELGVGTGVEFRLLGWTGSGNNWCGTSVEIVFLYWTGGRGGDF